MTSRSSLVLSLTLLMISALAACASTEQRSANAVAANPANANAPDAPAWPTTPKATPSPDNGIPVAPAHSSGAAAAPPAASEETGMDTAALDAQIVKAEERAKAKNATSADKQAAAAAYLERANLFMNAGRPALYKFALRDYRRTLHYQPDNEQARASSKTIVDIYKSMGRPVPELGNEP